MKKKIILASTSTLYGQTYLSYLAPALKVLFKDIKELVFVPYARPGGISHDEYTARAAAFFNLLNIQVRGLHSFESPARALENAAGFFTGGGNTFLLMKQLLETKLLDTLKKQVEAGKPYLGTSAGSNIGGLTIQTTNDMPIVYPPGFKAMGLVPFNLNPHYPEQEPATGHMGETRETRIKEFHSLNNIPVVGLREGSWIRVEDERITLEGQGSARIFEQSREPYELDPEQANEQQILRFPEYGNSYSY